MKSSRFWLAVLVAGVVVTILDYFVQGQLFASIYYRKMTGVMKQDTGVQWFIFGDFVAVLVFTWVYNKVWSVFGPGARGGAVCGFFLGVLVSFPTFHFDFLMFKEYPYGLAWSSTIYQVIWYVIAGIVIAAVMKKSSPKSSTPANP